MNLISQILSNKSESQFEKVALEIFDYQFLHCSVYREYVRQLNWKKPENISQIPFLPISFFKSHKVISEKQEAELIFKSSGTTGKQSKHFVASAKLYEETFLSCYQKHVGRPKEQIIFALLPNYLEQGDSSLVYMVDYLIQKSENTQSGFYLQNEDQFIKHYKQSLGSNKQIVIIGVTYALLDLCEKKMNLSEAIVIETGGMKGRRKELTKKEIHEKLRVGLSCNNIYSEYGMTELLSQSYSIKNGLFEMDDSIRFKIREINDPFSYCSDGKTGGVNIIDLANLESCSFIATQDVGRIVNGQLELLGRYDHSDIRGCNLLLP